ncbi:helix-turn-helix domain-containing protein [Mucilaginibacter terrigena]|uniref:helix-turn-helix domain-containing protein n=1 Tax=Mucilaginibacter terrigena TaxID=2492395 RepID=UPI0021CF2529|nr:helix-turn-helix domain-containing protein [Mucilaginibacter terrigena]
MVTNHGLTTALKAKEIAYDLGYDDPAYFSRLFQIKTGESPSGFIINDSQGHEQSGYKKFHYRLFWLSQ